MPDDLRKIYTMLRSLQRGELEELRDTLSIMLEALPDDPQTGQGAADDDAPGVEIKFITHKGKDGKPSKPYGPYLYKRWWENGVHKTKYLGKPGDRRRGKA